MRTKEGVIAIVFGFIAIIIMGTEDATFGFFCILMGLLILADNLIYFVEPWIKELERKERKHDKNLQ